MPRRRGFPRAKQHNYKLGERSDPDYLATLRDRREQLRGAPPASVQLQKAGSRFYGDTHKDARNAAQTDIPAKEIVGAPGTQSQPSTSAETTTPAPRAETANPPSPATPPGPATPSAPPTPFETAADCIKDDTLKGQVISYLGGDDLDSKAQFNLYARWSDISCLPDDIINDDKKRFSAGNQARAIRLLASTVINNSGQTAKTYWQPLGPKRDFTKPLPAYFDETLRKSIFALLAADDDTVRAEAIRLIKLVPDDQFETLFQSKLAEMVTWQGPPAVRERYAIAANAFYYNRIVEWLNVPDQAKAAQRAAAYAQVSNKDFPNAQQWMRDDFFVGRSSKPFLAMLLYAKGIVEHELESIDDFGKATFKQMLSTLELTGDPYPSRALHIAQALVLSSDVLKQQEETLLKTVQNATELDVGRVVDQAGFGTTSYDLFIAPDSRKRSPPESVTASEQPPAQLLLQSADWYLIRKKGKIGWAHNAAKS